MFRAFNLSSKYGRSKAEKILLTYQTFAISVKVPTPYTTQPPCHNCVAILGGTSVNKKKEETDPNDVTMIHCELTSTKLHMAKFINTFLSHCKQIQCTHLTPNR